MSDAIHRQLDRLGHRGLVGFRQQGLALDGQSERIDAGGAGAVGFALAHAASLIAIAACCETPATANICANGCP